MRSRTRRLAAGITLLGAVSVAGSSCTYYGVAPAGAPVTPSTYDRAWNAAQQAAQDAGLRVTSVDRATGTIQGDRAAIAATILVLLQADGRTRVELKLQGPLQTDPTLSDRFYSAYERYMGR